MHTRGSRAWSLRVLQTLPAGTKPVTWRHRSPGKGRRKKRKRSTIWLRQQQQQKKKEKERKGKKKGKKRRRRKEEGLRQSEEHWNRFKGNAAETGWSAHGLFRARNQHLEHKTWTEPWSELNYRRRDRGPELARVGLGCCWWCWWWASWHEAARWPSLGGCCTCLHQSAHRHFPSPSASHPYRWIPRLHVPYKHTCTLTSLCLAYRLTYHSCLWCLVLAGAG